MKIDHKKELKHLYKPSPKKVEFIEVPAMIDGKGNPNTAQEYKDSIETLFPLSYALKFMVKKSELGMDYAVMPLEGLWWAEDMSLFNANKKDDWLWTSMMMQPDFITVEMVEEAMENVREKKNPAALDKVRFESFAEGKAAQIMHLGPFSEEGPTIEKLHAAIKEKGYQLSGKHHEIYLSDTRRAAPENWKTIIRQPYQ